jgi:pyruvate dehydrogenase E1 component alpha subunit
MFGDGAMNQGMLLESMNLAAVWRLPMVFVCKDNGWAITTRTASVTAGDFCQRAEGLGLPSMRVDGLDAAAVRDVAGRAIERARAGKGPSFLCAAVARLDGHMVGDPLVRMSTRPNASDRARVRPIIAEATATSGGGLGARAGALLELARVSLAARKGGRGRGNDPIRRMRRRITRKNADRIDEEVAREMEAAVASAQEVRT